MSNVPIPFGGGGQLPAHPPSYLQQQNAQTPPMNGTPSQQMPASMPTLDPALQAMLQQGVLTPTILAQIAQSLQNGSLPLPPVGFAPPHPNVPTIAPVTDTRTPAQLQPVANAPDNSHSTNGDVDMDHEDGEIEDGEVDGGSTPQARGFLRTPPKGPAFSRRGSHQFQHQARPVSRPGMTPRASSSTIPTPIMANGKAPGPPSSDVRPNKEAASKAFVLEMHKAGYTYDDLAREVKDHKMLRRLYLQLGLPIPPPSSSVKAPVASQSVASPVNVTRKPPPANPAKAKDNSAYLAKLQAVKGKKSGTANVPATPPAATHAAQSVKPSSKMVQTATPAQPQPPPLTTPTVPPVVTAPVKKPVIAKANTAEIQRRLIALKAAQKAAGQSAKLSSEANQPSSPAPRQAAPSPRSGPGVGLKEASATIASRSVPALAPTQPSQQMPTTRAVPSSTTASPIVNRGEFSLPGLSLPGLYNQHAPPSTLPRSSPRPNTTTYSASAQQPTLSSSGLASVINATQQPFGQSHDPSSTERCVIEVSSVEDEGREDDDGDEMDIGGSSEEEQAPAVNPPPTAAVKATAPTNKASNSTVPSAPATPESWQSILEKAAALKQNIAKMEGKGRRKVPTPSSALPSSPSGSVRVSSPHLRNGISTPLRDSQTPTSAIAAKVSALTQNKEERENESKLLGPKQDSGNTAFSSETKSPSAAVDDHPATFNANDATSDIDDGDDEDLYGEDGETQATDLQQPQGTRRSPLVDSSAITVPEDAPVDTAGPQAVGLRLDRADDDLYHAMEVDRTVGEASFESTAADVDYPDKSYGDEDEGDDGLDNVYEPPPAIETTPLDHPPHADEEDEDSDDAMDTSEEASGDSDSESSNPDLDTDLAVAPVPASPMRSAVSAGANDGQAAQDPCPDVDLAPELQPVNDGQDRASTHDAPPRQSLYTPYDSVLKHFKDYRYHPEFTNTVSTGFKSLTYNHKIDSMRPVCPTEMHSGQCTDKECGYQHFRDMMLEGTCCSCPRGYEDAHSFQYRLLLLLRSLTPGN